MVSGRRHLKKVILKTGVIAWAVPACWIPWGCFGGETEIDGPDGKLRIDETSSGRRVFSWSSSEGLVERSVSSLFVSKAPATYSLTFEHGIIEKVTESHRFFDLTDRTYKEVGKIAEGFVGLYLDGKGETKSVRLLKKQRKEHSSTSSVYTIGVNGVEENFFANGFLAHNKSPPDDDDNSATPTFVDDDSATEESTPTPEDT